MLNKLDLAKKFELVVQQEIKNYQDSFNNVLNSINELRDSLDSLRSEVSCKFAKIQSSQGTLASEIYSIKEHSLSTSDILNRSINDQRVLNERINCKILDIESENIQKHNAFIRNKDSLDVLDRNIHRIENSFEKNIISINQNLDDLFKRFMSALDKNKRDIMELPSESSLIKRDLEEKIASHSVDVVGIMKEIQIFKRENYITQKKLENIYTSIERLKKI